MLPSDDFLTSSHILRSTSSAQFFGLEAAIEHLAWRGEVLELRYVLRQVSSETFSLREVEEATCIFSAEKGNTLPVEQVFYISFDETFRLAARGHFDSEGYSYAACKSHTELILPPQKAHMIVVQLGACPLVTKPLALPRRDDRASVTNKRELILP